MKDQFTTNADEVFNRFMNLTFKDMRKALKAGLRQALQKIVKDARNNLKSSFKNTTKRGTGAQYNDPLVKGIRKTRLHEEKNGEMWGKVRAHREDGKPHSRAYILPMLENGTQPRYVHKRNGKPLKKPAYRGQIPSGAHFFKRAVDSNRETFKQTLVNELDKVITKIFNKAAKQ